MVLPAHREVNARCTSRHTYPSACWSGIQCECRRERLTALPLEIGGWSAITAVCKHVGWDWRQREMPYLFQAYAVRNLQLSLNRLEHGQASPPHLRYLGGQETCVEVPIGLCSAPRQHRPPCRYWHLGARSIHSTLTISPSLLEKCPQILTQGPCILYSAKLSCAQWSEVCR